MSIKESIFILFFTLICLSFENASADQHAIDINYDLRYRYEYTDDGSKNSTRRRNRVRSRLGATISPNEKIKIGIRFATAEANPTSANQNLGHEFSLQDAGIDQLYIEYSATENLGFMVGKVKNPFFKTNKSQLIFDNDYSPEGLALKVKKGKIFGSLGVFSMDEHESVDDVSITGLQIGISSSTLGGAKYKIALARYTFDDIRGRPASEITWNGKIYGNPTDDNQNYLNDFSLTNLSAEISSKVGSLAIPAVFFVDWATNSDASGNDKGIQIGAMFSLTEMWKITYLYKDVEKNSVFGALVDSDFGGGGVGHKGHQINLGYKFSKNFSAEFTFFDNDKNMTVDYTKVFVDLKYKY